MPATITVTGTGDFTPALVGNHLQMGGSTASSSLGSAVFEPVSPHPIDAFGATFYVRIDPSAVESSGISLSVFDAQQHGPGTVLGVSGAPTGWSLWLRPKHAPSSFYDKVELRLDGQVVASADPAIDFDDGVWRLVGLEIAAGQAWVRVIEGGQFTTIIDGASVPAFQPLRARYGFGTLSVSGGADPDVFVDQVSFEDWSGPGSFDRDLNDNGTLDSCEAPATQVSRVGVPANPDVLSFDAASGPMMGEAYGLWIDHASFMPTAQLDWLLVSLQQSNLPLSPLGTLLCGTDPFLVLQQAAGTTFEIQIPVFAELLAAPLTFQGGSIDVLVPTPGGGTTSIAEFTNAVDTTVGAWAPGN